MVDEKVDLENHNCIEEVIVLHQYGAPRHFLALTYLMKKEKIKKIRWIEFDLPLQVVRGIIKKNPKYFLRAADNTKELLKLISSKNKTIIVGAAPFDPIIFFLRIISKKNFLIYFTSWPFWDGSKYVIRPLSNKQREIWYNFLNGRISVSVIQSGCDAIKNHNAEAYYIPHCVDTHIFTPNKNKTERIVVLFVGSFIYRKGVLVLLDAIKGINKENKNIEFWFVGSGPLEEKIKKASQNYPIKILGQIRDNKRLIEIYHKADMFILPSIDGKDIENFGIVLIEAMASGLPVITTDCVGPKEIIKNGITGFVIPQNNKEKMEEAILKLANNANLRTEMGSLSRKQAQEKYDVEQNSDRWFKVLNIKKNNNEN